MAYAPDETYIIGSQKEYDNFFFLYELSSIYPLDTVDFDSECLIYCGYRSAQDVRGWAGKIQKIRVSDTQLDLIEDTAVNYQAERQEEAVAYQVIDSPDCAVREIYLLIVQNDDLPQTLFDQYRFSQDS